MTTSLIATREGRVMRLKLNRPEKRNALRIGDCGHLLAALNEAELDDSVGTILIEGADPEFCSGMDLTEAVEEYDPPEQAAIHNGLFTIGGRITKPIVAAVQGKALAGGLGLVANAHIVVASADAGFGLTEIRIALFPFIVFRSVAAAIGERRALELALTGRIVGAAEAHQWGLVHHVAPPDELTERALAVATAISRFSPEALRRGLDYVHRTRSASEQEAVQLSDVMRRRSFQSADFTEGVEAFFDKREPRWPSLEAVRRD